MGEAAVLVGDDADRQRHQRHAVQLTAPVLAEIVPRPPVLLVVLWRDRWVEHLQHLPAYVRDGVERDDEDEVIPADMPHESTVAEHPFHHVVQDAGQDIDDAIAVIVAVAIVVLLEMIQIRVAHSEQLTILHASSYLALDLGGAGQARGRIHGDVAGRARHEPVEPYSLLGRLAQWRDDLIRAGGEPLLHPLRGMATGEHRQRHDGRVGIGLEAGTQLQARGSPLGADHAQPGPREQYQPLDLAWNGEWRDREGSPVPP